MIFDLLQTVDDHLWDIIQDCFWIASLSSNELSANSNESKAANFAYPAHHYSPNSSHVGWFEPDKETRNAWRPPAFSSREAEWPPL